jgi:hypothetical protein
MHGTTVKTDSRLSQIVRTRLKIGPPQHPLQSNTDPLVGWRLQPCTEMACREHDTRLRAFGSSAADRLNIALRTDLILPCAQTCSVQSAARRTRADLTYRPSAALEIRFYWTGGRGRLTSGSFKANLIDPYTIKDFPFFCVFCWPCNLV